MHRMLHAQLLFFRTHWVASIGISLACGYVVLTSGLAILSALLILKAISAGVILYFLNELRPNDFYFYHNIGLSKRAILLGSFAIDMLLFVAIITAVVMFSI